MFDARSLLESLVRGPAQQNAPQQHSGQQHSGSADPAGQLGDLLRQLTQGGRQPAAPHAAPGSSGQAPTAGQAMGLDDLLGNLFPGAGAPQAPAAAPPSSQQAPSSGGLGDIFGRIQEQMSGGQSRDGAAANGPSSTGGSPNPLDMLGQIFGEATQGVQEGAGRVGQATGMNEIIEKMSGGRSPEELLEQVKRYMSENKLGTGAALGGLGALILGTQTGRSVAASAAKIGALALIGGLAYKAYQNYAAGRPLISNGQAPAEPAPPGSGFEESNVSNDGAITMIRAMIAASAADGRIDSTEQQKILGNLQGAGLDAAAEEFLANELNNPASIEALAASAASQEEAIKIYTAARIAIDPDTGAEQAFLYHLGERLGIDEELMAHIDAQARAIS